MTQEVLLYINTGLLVLLAVFASFWFKRTNETINRLDLDVAKLKSVDLDSQVDLRMLSCKIDLSEKIDNLVKEVRDSHDNKIAHIHVKYDSKIEAMQSQVNDIIRPRPRHAD